MISLDEFISMFDEEKCRLCEYINKGGEDLKTDSFSSLHLVRSGNFYRTNGLLALLDPVVHVMVIFKCSSSTCKHGFLHILLDCRMHFLLFGNPSQEFPSSFRANMIPTARRSERQFGQIAGL
jgi:hypothetical protein